MEWHAREQVDALARRLQALLPGRLTRDESLTLAQYAAAMDANPFRGEIYAYTDHRGKLVLVEGYKLLVRWARRQCNFSERYEPVKGEELPEGAIGYKCRILRDDARATLSTLCTAGAPWDAAFEIVSQEAVGVVTQKDMTTSAGKPMDPPTGWTWQEVARKRALKNALNRAYGAPSPKDIARESWMVGDIETSLEDWQLAVDDASDNATPGEVAQTAATIAHQRENPVTEEVARAARQLLFPDDEGSI
jgi:hypothetical protein